MDDEDELGNFFSEIEKVVTYEAFGENTEAGDNAVSLTSSREKDSDESSSSNSSSSLGVRDNEEVRTVVSTPQVIAKAPEVIVKTVKAAPNITYASSSSSSISTTFYSQSDSVVVVPETDTSYSSANNLTSTSSSSTSSSYTTNVPSFIKAQKTQAPPMPTKPVGKHYSSTPLIMTGAQMQAALQPAIPQPIIPIQNKKFVRTGAGEVWVDNTLNEWPANDFRLFVGDLGNEVTTEMLAKEFQKYKTFAKAKVVRGGWNNKSKGYGFVSFMDPFDCAKALREMNGKYIGNRPMKLRKSTWKDNDINEVKKKDKKKRKLAESLGLA